MRSWLVRLILTTAGAVLLVLLLNLSLSRAVASSDLPPRATSVPSAASARLALVAQGVVSSSVTHLPIISKAHSAPLRPIPLGEASALFQPADINNNGQIVGSAYIDQVQSHAFVWQDGVMTDVGTLGGEMSRAVAINDHGQVAGVSSLRSGYNPPLHVFLWAGGVMTDVGTLGAEWGEAIDINEQGWVVGYSATASGLSHGFVWANGVITDLGTLGGSETFVTDISDRGQIVGSSTTADGRWHAFLWENGRMTDIGAAWADSAYGTHAAAINERGQVAGYSVRGGQVERGFLWADGMLTDLGGFGSTVNRVDALNDRGQVVGYAYVPSTNTGHAFLWQDGVVTDLGVPFNAFARPALINNDGWVVLDQTLPNIPWDQGLLWRSGVLTKLAAGDGSGGSYATAMNDRGQIVGVSWTADATRGSLWNSAAND